MRLQFSRFKDRTNEQLDIQKTQAAMGNALGTSERAGGAGVRDRSGPVPGCTSQHLRHSDTSFCMAKAGLLQAGNKGCDVRKSFLVWCSILRSFLDGKNCSTEPRASGLPSCQSNRS